MTKRVSGLHRVAWVCVGFLMAWTAAHGAPAKAGSDPRAERALRRFTDYLALQTNFSVDIEAVLRVRAGNQEQRNRAACQLFVARPDRVAVWADKAWMGTTMVSDGTNVYVFSPVGREHVVRPAPRDIVELFRPAQTTAPQSGMVNTYIIDSLVHTNAYEPLMEGVIGSLYLGTQTAGNVECHHMKFVQDGFDWDLWVDAGETPLAQKIVTDASKARTRRIGVASPNVSDEIEIVWLFQNWSTEATPADTFAVAPDSVTARAVEWRSVGRRGGGDTLAPAAEPTKAPPAGRWKTGAELAWSLEGTWVAVATDPVSNVVYAVNAEGQGMVVDAVGRERRRYQLEDRMRILRSVNLIKGAETELLGFNRWGFSIMSYSMQGKHLRTYSEEFGINDVWGCDVDADTLDEIVVGCNGTGGLNVLGQSGRILWRCSELKNVWHVCGGNFDGQVRVLCTSASGKVSVFAQDGRRLADLDPGCYANVVRVGRAPGPIVAVAGSAGREEMLVGMTLAGEKKWTTPLPAPGAGLFDSAACAETAPWMAIGIRGGSVHVADLGTGRIVDSVTGQGQWPQVCWLPQGTNALPLLVVATGAKLNAFRIFEPRAGPATEGLAEEAGGSVSLPTNAPTGAR